tara:strand:+ start:418 stop:1035 length:618 start_codon:yes stop_codon:yes gene_type:complete
MKQLAKAVIEVMKEVRGMEKNSSVGSGKSAYNGTKDQDVKEVFNKAMSDNGLCMIPFDIQEETQVDRWEEKTDWGLKQKQSVFTKAVVKYTLLHESGESTIVCGYGHGVDPQDKGAGKATTYAMKNALLYTFLTPVGKIDDTDTTHSNDIEVKKVIKPNLTDKLLQDTLLNGSIDDLRALLNDYNCTGLQKKAITIRGKELKDGK